MQRLKVKQCFGGGRRPWRSYFRAESDGRSMASMAVYIFENINKNDIVKKLEIDIASSKLINIENT